MEEVCEEFESQWRRYPGHAAERIQAFLNRYSIDHTSRRSLVGVLAEVDLERDWMWWKKWLAIEGESLTPADVMAEYSKNAKASDYRSLFGDPTLDPEIEQRLRNVEMKCREIWGDDPYPVSLPHLHEDKTFITKSWISIHFDEPTDKLRCPFKGVIELGRQRSTELVERQWVRDGGNSRIILANRDDIRYSRRQCSLQKLSPDFAMVTNLSQVNPLIISPDVILGASESILCRLPFHIRIPDIRIDVESIQD